MCVTCACVCVECMEIMAMLFIQLVFLCIQIFTRVVADAGNSHCVVGEEKGLHYFPGPVCLLACPPPRKSGSTLFQDHLEGDAKVGIILLLISSFLVQWKITPKTYILLLLV